MSPRLIALAVAGALLLPSAASAELPAFSTGNDLLAACQSSSHYDQGFCQGYLFGVVHYLNAVGNHVCRFDGVTSGQMQDIAVRFLRDNPEGRHWPALSQAVQALMQTFPCEEGDQP
jgi:hypothetical protein